jgi:hypothetical protein
MYKRIILISCVGVKVGRPQDRKTLDRRCLRTLYGGECLDVRGD